MKIEITDEMVDVFVRALVASDYNDDVALEAVAHLIADMALERAAELAEETAKTYVVHTNVGAMIYVGVTNKVASAIRALKEKRS